MNILVSGSLVYDRIMDFPGRFRDYILPGKEHDFDVSFAVPALKENFGGTAGNIAYTLALLGEKPAVLGAVGADFSRYRSRLVRHGVDARRIVTIRGKPTPVCTIITDRADNQISAIHLGAMKHSCVPARASSLRAPFAVVAPGNIRDMVRLARAYRARGIPYMFDPGQMAPALAAGDLKRGIAGAAVFISNDYELELVKKKTSWGRKEILSRAGVLVTTLGEKGSAIYAGKMAYAIPPAKPKRVVDPTGAGDAYRAGFLKGFLSGWPLEVCGRFAAVVACYAVETYGTQVHSLTFAEAKKRYRKNFGPFPEFVPTT